MAFLLLFQNKEILCDGGFDPPAKPNAEKMVEEYGRLLEEMQSQIDQSSSVSDEQKDDRESEKEEEEEEEEEGVEEEEVEEEDNVDRDDNNDGEQWF